MDGALMDESSQRLREDLSGLEGQLLATRIIQAMTAYSLLHSVPLDHVYRVVSRHNQVFAENTHFLFGNRAFFHMGFTSTMKSFEGMIRAVGEIVDASKPPA